MEEIKELSGFDSLDIKHKPAITNQLGSNEIVYYSANVTKFNRLDWKQERLFLITNLAVYNIKKTSIKRRITIKDIDGITISTDPKCFEFVIHIEVEYDYRYNATKAKRDDILYVLKHWYYKAIKRNLPVFGVCYANLKDFVTSKKDASKHIFKKPPKGNLLKNENLFDDEGKDAKSSAKKADESKDDSSSIDKSMSSQSSIHSTGTIFSEEQSKPKNKEIVPEVTLADFDIEHATTKEGLGKIKLVKRFSDGKTYAMKCINKEAMTASGQLEYVEMEKRILMQNKHPFMLSLSYVFQTEEKVYFIMPYIRGGQLFLHLNSEKRFSEDKARFYALQIMLSIGYLHKQGIVYRDIKPENILMGDDGYLLLTEFGLSKKIEAGDLASTFWGTPEYLAPEIISEKGHDHAVDWWACGILIYEMIVGFPPFYHKNLNSMYDLILKFPVRFPDPVKHGIDMSDDVKDIIERLLDKEPKTRLGYERGIHEILEHPWFQGIEVDKLLNKELDAPFIPKIDEPKEVIEDSIDF